jgi:hypothetical protein
MEAIKNTDIGYTESTKMEFDNSGVVLKFDIAKVDEFKSAVIIRRLDTNTPCVAVWCHEYENACSLEVFRLLCQDYFEGIYSDTIEDIKYRWDIDDNDDIFAEHILNRVARAVEVIRELDLDDDTLTDMYKETFDCDPLEDY